MLLIAAAPLPPTDLPGQCDGSTFSLVNLKRPPFPLNETNVQIFIKLPQKGTR
jgi:hypothetical protein